MKNHNRCKLDLEDPGWSFSSSKMTTDNIDPPQAKRQKTEDDAIESVAITTESPMEAVPEVSAERSDMPEKGSLSSYPSSSSADTPVDGGSVAAASLCLRVDNLPKYDRAKEVKKMLANHGLHDYAQLRKIEKKDFAFISFAVRIVKSSGNASLTLSPCIAVSLPRCLAVSLCPCLAVCRTTTRRKKRDRFCRRSPSRIVSWSSAMPRSLLCLRELPPNKIPSPWICRYQNMNG